MGARVRGAGIQDGSLSARIACPALIQIWVQGFTLSAQSASFSITWTRRALSLERRAQSRTIRTLEKLSGAVDSC